MSHGWMARARTHWPHASQTPDRSAGDLQGEASESVAALRTGRLTCRKVKVLGHTGSTCFPAETGFRTGRMDRPYRQARMGSRSRGKGLTPNWDRTDLHSNSRHNYRSGPEEQDHDWGSDSLRYLVNRRCRTGRLGCSCY